MADNDRLTDQDVMDVVALVSDASSLPGPTRRRRKALLDALAELVEADMWLWAYSRVDRGCPPPVNLQFQYGKMSLRQGVNLGLRGLGVFGVPPEAGPLTEATFRGRHFTRSIGQLVGHEFWATDAKTRTYVRCLGIDDVVYSIKPVENLGDRIFFSGLALGRKLRRPFFSDRERRLIHIVFGSVAWLHTEGTSKRHHDEVSKLPPSLRGVVPLLIHGKTYPEIAAARSLSEHTIKEYVHNIYKIMGVRNRGELIAKFAIGDESGPSPTDV